MHFVTFSGSNFLTKPGVVVEANLAGVWKLLGGAQLITESLVGLVALWSPQSDVTNISRSGQL